METVKLDILVFKFFNGIFDRIKEEKSEESNLSERKLSDTSTDPIFFDKRAKKRIADWVKERKDDFGFLEWLIGDQKSSKIFQKHEFMLFKSDFDIDGRISKFFRELDSSLSMMFEIKFYRGFMMKILPNNCLVFLKINKVSRNFIKVALFFYTKHNTKYISQFEEVISNIKNYLQSIKNHQKFEIFHPKVMKFLKVKKNEVRGGRVFYSYVIKNYYDPFFNDKITKEYAEFLTKRVDKVRYFSNIIHQRVVQFIYKQKFIHMASYTSFDKTPCLKFIKEKSVIINGSKYVYYILIEFNFVDSVLHLIRGVLLIDNPFIIDEVFKVDKEYSLIKKNVNAVISVSQNHIQLYRFTLVKTIRYLKTLNSKGLNPPVSFAVQRRILLERKKGASSNPFYYKNSTPRSSILGTKIADIETRELIEFYEKIADEWGWRNIKKLEKRKIWDYSTIKDCYKF